MNTFAVHIDPKNFVNTPRFIVAVELLAFGFILFQLNVALVWISVVLYILFIWQRKRQFHSIIILVQSPANQHFQILMLDFYTVFLPLALLIDHATASLNGWIVLCLHVILFYKIILTVCSDTYHLIRNIARRLFN
jgi:hypothetical protein